MAAGLATRIWDTLPRLADILAIELAFAAQAAESRRHAEAVPTKISLFLDEEDDHEEPLPDADAAERAVRADERTELRSLKEALERRATEVMNRRLAVSRDEDAEQQASGPRVVRVELAARHRIDPEARLLSPVCERVRGRILDVFPALSEDRYMSRELRALSRLVLEGGLADSAADALI
jgi:histidine ammonia-lyase